MIIPSGSCNSLTSILYGLSIYKPKVNKLVLVEIGPTRRDWVKERLHAIRAVAKSDVAQVLDDGRYAVERHDLHRSKYVSYQDVMPFSYHGIDFHPRYEGKVMTYLMDRAPELINPDNVLWIIGGESKVDAMRRALLQAA